jgi:hypothetical protein
VECGIEMKHVCFVVATELVLDRVPDLVCSDIMLLGDIRKLVGDRARDLGEDNGLHAVPGRVVDGRCVGEDAVGEFVALEGEQNLITPASVACRRRILNSRDKGVNVLYLVSLRVEHGDDGGVTPGGSGWQRAGEGGGGRRQLQDSHRSLDL